MDFEQTIDRAIDVLRDCHKHALAEQENMVDYVQFILNDALVAAGVTPTMYTKGSPPPPCPTCPPTKP